MDCVLFRRHRYLGFWLYLSTPSTHFQCRKIQEFTDVLPHIHPWADKTHIHRPSGGDSNGSIGILLTRCQGLNSVGSASRRQPPRRACSIYAALPHPTPIHWHFKFHSMSSFVKNIHPLSPFNQSMSFSCMSFHIGGYLDGNGPQQKRTVKWNYLRNKVEIPNSFLHLPLSVSIKISLCLPVPLHCRFFSEA